MRRALLFLDLQIQPEPVTSNTYNMLGQQTERERESEREKKRVRKSV